ncbi:MAG: HEAT repeat domain-containing protein [Myxococcota bacterium]
MKLWNQTGVLSAGLLALALVAGCGGDAKKKDAKGTDAGANTEASKPEMKLSKKAEDLKVKASDVKSLVKKGTPIDAATYKKLILAHADCKVTENGIDSKCEAVTAMREAMNRSQLAKGLLGGNAKLGVELIDHEAPAVRIKAAKMMGSMIGSAKESQDAIVARMDKEDVPAVMKAMVRTVRNAGAKNPKVGEMLLKLADHKDPMIRKEAIYGLSSSFNKELEGGPEKLIALMKDDEDADVRRKACKHAGGLGDAKLFPAYKELLQNREDGKLWGSCFEGLVAMWADYPLYGTDSQDAYKLTMELLKSKPRTKEIPPWTVMSRFGYLNGEKNEKLTEWKKKATWFKLADLNKVLQEIVTDKDANWMTRTGSVKALAKTGEKADLEKLRKTFGDDPKGDESHVAKALDKAIAGEK